MRRVEKSTSDDNNNNNNRLVLFPTSSRSRNVQFRTINHKREKAYRGGRASQRRALTTQ